MSDVPDNKTLDKIVYGRGRTGIQLDETNSIVRIQNWQCAILIIKGSPYPCFRINDCGPWFGFPVGVLQSTGMAIPPEECVNLFCNDLAKCAERLDGFRD